MNDRLGYLLAFSPIFAGLVFAFVVALMAHRDELHAAKQHHAKIRVARDHYDEPRY